MCFAAHKRFFVKLSKNHCRGVKNGLAESHRGHVPQKRVISSRVPTGPIVTWRVAHTKGYVSKPWVHEDETTYVIVFFQTTSLLIRSNHYLPTGYGKPVCCHSNFQQLQKGVSPRKLRIIHVIMSRNLAYCKKKQTAFCTCKNRIPLHWQQLYGAAYKLHAFVHQSKYKKHEVFVCTTACFILYGA